MPHLLTTGVTDPARYEAFFAVLKLAAPYAAQQGITLGLKPHGGISGTNRDCVAAISVGIVSGQPALDLNYAEDSTAEVDMNVVMTGSGEFVEVQGTAEQVPFSRSRLDDLLALAERGIRRLVALQRRALDARAERSFKL